MPINCLNIGPCYITCVIYTFVITVIPVISFYGEVNNLNMILAAIVVIILMNF